MVSRITIKDPSLYYPAPINYHFQIFTIIYIYTMFEVNLLFGKFGE